MQTKINIISNIVLLFNLFNRFHLIFNYVTPSIIIYIFFLFSFQLFVTLCKLIEYMFYKSAFKLLMVCILLIYLPKSVVIFRALIMSVYLLDHNFARLRRIYYIVEKHYWCLSIPICYGCL